MTAMMVLTLGFSLKIIQTGKKEKALKLEQYDKEYKTSSENKE